MVQEVIMVTDNLRFLRIDPLILQDLRSLSAMPLHVPLHQLEIDVAEDPDPLPQIRICAQVPRHRFHDRTGSEAVPDEVFIVDKMPEKGN